MQLGALKIGIYQLNVGINNFMTRSTFEMGLCDVKNCQGFIQHSKIDDTFYCLECGKNWEASEWEWLKEQSKEKEYHENTDVENLNKWNNM